MFGKKLRMSKDRYHKVLLAVKPLQLSKLNRDASVTAFKLLPKPTPTSDTWYLNPADLCDLSRRKYTNKNYQMFFLG